MRLVMLRIGTAIVLASTVCSAAAEAAVRITRVTVDGREVAIDPAATADGAPAIRLPAGTGRVTLTIQGQADTAPARPILRPGRGPASCRRCSARACGIGSTATTRAGGMLRHSPGCS